MSSAARLRRTGLLEQTVVGGLSSLTYDAARGVYYALVQDGPAATTATGSPARILRYHLDHGGSDREYVYPTDPVAAGDTNRIHRLALPGATALG
jgi:hypothetical protein